MFKRSILLLLLLAIFTIASSNVKANKYDNYQVSVKVFELDDHGVNMVDSAFTTFNKDSIALFQWVYYIDGRVSIYFDYLNMNDLKMRNAYIYYKNSHSNRILWSDFKENCIRLNNTYKYIFQEPPINTSNFIAVSLGTIVSEIPVLEKFELNNTIVEFKLKRNLTNTLIESSFDSTESSFLDKQRSPLVNVLKLNNTS